MFSLCLNTFFNLEKLAVLIEVRGFLYKVHKRVPKTCSRQWPAKRQRAGWQYNPSSEVNQILKTSKVFKDVEYEAGSEQSWWL